VFADEGIGMDERAQASYFQPFHSAFGEGTGLGAAIVYRLVEEHGGRIGIESKPGLGARVHILIPRVGASARSEEAGAPAPLARWVDLNRILIAEDEKSLRDLLALMLRKGDTRSTSRNPGPARRSASIGSIPTRS